MDILEKIKALQLPADQFVVMGSAILQLKGIRDANDIDIIVTHSLFKQLKSNDDWEYEVKWGEIGDLEVASLDNRDGVTLYDYIYGGGEIEYFLSDPRHTEIVEGIRFASLENLLRVKGTAWDRPKDLLDAELIRAYLELHKL